jgi:hypothetical protein
MSQKSFFKQRRNALYSKDGTIAITNIENIPRLEIYTEMSFTAFAKWNEAQEEKHDWFINTVPFYGLKKIVDYLGYSLEDFTVYLPKITHPILFKLDGMCFLVAPFLGYAYSGIEPNWQEQPQSIADKETKKAEQ